jgi:hypothetical protein
VEKTTGYVLKENVLVCLYGNFEATINVIPDEPRTVDGLAKQPWPNNATLVYEMFERFNIYK